MCGLPKATKIKQFSDVIPQKIVERLELIYEDVDDVDLFIAGISETPVKGKPSFFCLKRIKQQKLPKKMTSYNTIDQ